LESFKLIEKLRFHQIHFTTVSLYNHYMVYNSTKNLYVDLMFQRVNFTRNTENICN